MGIVIKQSIRSSFLAYIGVALGAVNILFIFPRFLSADQIGLVRVIPSAAFLMATFAQLGLAQGILKFLPSFSPGTRKRKEYLGFTLLTALLGYITLLGITYLFKDQLEQYYNQKSPLFMEYFQVSLIVTLFLLYIQLAEAYSRSLLKSIPPVAIRDVLLRVMTTASVLLYASEIIDFDLFVQLFIVLYGIALLSHVIYFISIKALAVSLRFKEFNKKDVVKILKYGAFTVIGAGGSQIVLQIDSLMLAGLEGLKEAGIYSIAFFIGTIIEIPRRSIGQITTPLISQAFEKGDMKKVAQLYKQTSINQLIIGALLMIGVWANLEAIYQLMPNGEIYSAGLNVVLLIGVGKLIAMMSGVNGEIIVMSKYYKFNVLTIAILAIAMIVGNSLLIPEYGIEGAAFASLVAMVLYNLTKFGFVYWKFGIQPFSSKTIIFIAVIGVVVLLNLLIPELQNVYLDIVVRSAALGITLVSLSYFLKISPEINGILNRLIGRFLKSV